MSAFLGLTPFQERVLSHYADNRLPVSFGGALAGWGSSVRALGRRRMLVCDERGIALTDKGRNAMLAACGADDMPPVTTTFAMRGVL